MVQRLVLNRGPATGGLVPQVPRVPRRKHVANHDEKANHVGFVRNAIGSGKLGEPEA